MTPSARIAAAIEVMADIETRRRPAVDALKDWGLSHRFAGSGDRAAITLSRVVFSVFVRKSSGAGAASAAPSSARASPNTRVRLASSHSG